MYSTLPRVMCDLDLDGSRHLEWPLDLPFKSIECKVTRFGKARVFVDIDNDLANDFVLKVEQ